MAGGRARGGNRVGRPYNSILQSDAAGVEGAGLDDIGPGVEIRAVDLLDHLRLRQHQGLGAIAKRDGVRAEAFAVIRLFIGLLREDQCSHRAVQNQDALFQ